MRRVFIISNGNFPRGGAISNYLQYLLLCINQCGYEAILVSNTNPEYIPFQKGLIQYKNFNIEPIIISSKRFIKHFQYKYGFTYERLSVLKKQGISHEDIVIVFGQNKYFYEQLLKMRKKRKYKIVGAVLEMFDRDNYSGSDLKYAKYQYVLENVLPRFDMLLPISTYIEEHYKKKGMKTTCLPIMADTQEFVLKQKNYDYWNFIIPANGAMKDALTEMLLAFTELTDNELGSLRLHLCGIKESVVRSVLTEKQFNKLERSLVIHKWMKYEELIELYQQMHFLFLSRDVSQMTLANFPSKVPETMCFGIVPIVSEVGDYTKYYLRDSVDSIFIKGYKKDECVCAIRKALQLGRDEFEVYSEKALLCVKNKFDYRNWTEVVGNMLRNI